MKKLEELGISQTPWKAGNFDVMTGEHVVAEIYDGLGGDENTENKEMIINNAYLIALAPELYRCLREAVIEVCHVFPCCSKDSEYECLMKDNGCFIQRWRKVLAKAAGEEAK